MSRRVPDHRNAMPKQYWFIRGMVSRLGFRQVPLVYERWKRCAGATRYPLSDEYLV